MSNETEQAGSRQFQAGTDPLAVVACEIRDEHIARHRDGLVRLGVSGVDLEQRMQTFIKQFDAEPKQTPATTDASRLADVSDEDFSRSLFGAPSGGSLIA
jgi:hypothetical protein